MALVPIRIPPGINNETPSLSSEPTWRDSDKVRFTAGQPEKIGGWTSDVSGIDAIKGIARSIHVWRLNNGIIMAAIGTHEKLYLFQDHVLYDITPIRETQNPLGNDPLDTTSGSAVVTVTDTGHGSTNGDYVTFSGAVCATLVDSEVNANHQITYVDGNTYTITVTTVATGTDALDGGNVVVGAYEIPVGHVSITTNYGWSSGAWGAEEWGDARATSTLTLEMRYWSLNNFGEDLVATHEVGRIYTWVYAGSFTNRAVVLSNSPLFNDIIVVTSPDRHLVALASETDGASQDKLSIAWADQETKNTWLASAENTAGNYTLSGGSQIMLALRSQNTTLIWTDTTLHSMQYIGPPFTFGFTEIATNCGAISKMCAINKDTSVYWMGKEDFFLYDGVVKHIPCSVHRSIFKNLAASQMTKITAGLITEFDEVIWFYPSSAGTENDKYVIYNYDQQVWCTGTMVRTAWIDTELMEFPLGLKPNTMGTTSTLYHHENGVDDDTSAMTAYIESADFDIEEGDRFFLISRLIPDMTIVTGDVDYTLKTRRYPHSTQVTDTTSTVSASTEKVDLRVRTRQVAIRITSDALLDDWRYGIPRIDIRKDGGR